MQYKYPDLKKELAFNAHNLLIDMVMHFDFLSRSLFGIEPTLTRIIEKVGGATEVHNDGKAADLRDEYIINTKGDTKRTYTDRQANLLCEKMNEKFQRYDKKQTCIHHSFRGGPQHFHLQVAPTYQTYAHK